MIPRFKPYVNPLYMKPIEPGWYTHPWFPFCDGEGQIYFNPRQPWRTLSWWVWYVKHRLLWASEKRTGWLYRWAVARQRREGWYQWWEREAHGSAGAPDRPTVER